MDSHRENLTDKYKKLLTKSADFVGRWPSANFLLSVNNRLVWHKLKLRNVSLGITIVAFMVLLTFNWE